MSSRDFKGVWIPKEIWLNEDLSLTEKCLLVEIDSLDNDLEKGCFASNEYLGKFIGISSGRTANIISDLKKRKFLKQVFFDGRNRGLRLHENVKKLHENVKAEYTKTLKQPSRKSEHINTGINTDTNTREIEGGNTKDIAKAKEDTPPPIFILGDDPDTAMQKATESLRQYLTQNPERMTDIPKSAQNRANEEQFKFELMDWIRYNANNRIVMQDPVKYLTSGPGNFTSWLAKDWCRKKYAPQAPRPAPQQEGPKYKYHQKTQR